MFPDTQAAIVNAIPAIYQGMLNALPASTQRHLLEKWQAEGTTIADRMHDTKMAADQAGVFDSCPA